MEPQQEESAKFLDYIVAYFDLMGQKEKLNRLRQVPTNEEEEKQFVDAANQTYAAVRIIRRGLKTGFENFSRASLAEISDDPTFELRKMVECNLQFHFYSDSFAVTCRCSNDENRPLIQHVFALLSSLSFMTITCLRNHTPVRGAVEIGKAFEWPEGDSLGIYGPVMLDVDELESRVAWYPRIVIGDKLNASMSDWAEKLDKGDRYYVCYKEIIESCKRMVWLDRDGMSTLDYLGASILSIAQSVQDPAMHQSVELGREFVRSEYKRLKDEKDFQLALKYSLLTDYYEERSPDWLTA